MDIADAAGLVGSRSDTRANVKSFITFAMGSSSKGETRSLCRLNGVNDDKFDSLVTAAEKLHPKLELFNG